MATEKMDHSHFKCCLIHYKNDLSHWRGDHNQFKHYLSHYLSDLSHCRSDYMLLNNYFSHYKDDLDYKTTDVATEATLKVISSTTKWISDHSHFTNHLSLHKSDFIHIRSDYILLNNYLSHYKDDLGH